MKFISYQQSQEVGVTTIDVLARFARASPQNERSEVHARIVVTPLAGVMGG